MKFKSRTAKNGKIIKPIKMYYQSQN